MPSSYRADGERGSATAELAVGMVAVAAVLVVCVGALGAAGAQVRLQHAAAHAAREQGRSQQTEIVCVTLTEPAPAPFNALTLRASSCAPGRGE